MLTSMLRHDDVIKWKHFPRNWPFVRGIHRSPVNSPHKGQWRGGLMFSLICVWINDWVNNREAVDLRRYHAHYDVIVMTLALNKLHHFAQDVFQIHTLTRNVRISIPPPNIAPNGPVFTTCLDRLRFSWWCHQMDYFPRHWPFVRGIHRSTVNSPHKGQWRGALMFSLICVWINDWVNNREAGDLRRHRGHYDVIVMLTWHRISAKQLLKTMTSQLTHTCVTRPRGFKCCFNEDLMNWIFDISAHKGQLHAQVQFPPGHKRRPPWSIFLTHNFWEVFKL